jgi:hypothetical protein
MTDRIGGWRHYRELTKTPDVELWQRAHASGAKFTFVPRLTGIKLAAGHRRDVYRTRPSHEQQHWFARIQNEPDFEFEQMASFVVGPAVPNGVPYRVLLRNFLRQTMARLRMRRAVVLPVRVPKDESPIDAVRRYKGLEGE